MINIITLAKTPQSRWQVMKRIQACGSQSGEVKGQSRRVEWWSPEFLAKLGIKVFSKL